MLWHNSIALQWLWVSNMLQVQKKSNNNNKKNLCAGFFFSVFRFFFFFSYAAKPKESPTGCAWQWPSEIFPRMISQVLATLLSAHQTLSLGSSTGAASPLGLNNTNSMNLSSWQPEQKLVLHQLCRASCHWVFVFLCLFVFYPLWSTLFLSPCNLEVKTPTVHY